MISALSDIQSKGDLMMGAIRGQRQVGLPAAGPTTPFQLLHGVREEVTEAETQLAKVERRRQEEEALMGKAEEQRLVTEAKTRAVQLETKRLEQELEEVEREREKSDSRLEQVRQEVEVIQSQMALDGKEMVR